MALNSENDQKSKLVLRVDQDSDLDLQALFDTVLKPDAKRPLQVPLRMRQLPKSFFNPPSTGSKSPSVSHSRENSADSAFGSATTPVAHSRAHSSPASLQQTYAAGQQQQQQQPPLHHHHAKQRSYDVGSHLHDDLGPLPPGWEQARTLEGQLYYLNHITRTTTWDDPRKTLAAQSVSQHQSADTLVSQPSQTNHTPTHTAAKAPVAAAVVVAVTSAATATTAATPTPTADALGPLPDGWEQATTPEGEIYFINHSERTTSWFDPRIPQHLQRAPAAGVVLPGSWSGGAALQACHQQKLRLQSLQLERERLKQRQQEIRLQQELMARQASSTVSGLSSSINTDLPLDPFLSSSLMTDHQRQESGDSGLGMGLPQSYSMPHTPEDFLEGIDDRMDCASEAGTAMDSGDTTDDLVPSLQLGEEFTTDILDDVQSIINSAPTKPDNVLTWL